MKILAVCPERESTKVALYENYEPLWMEVQTYTASELQEFPNIISQEAFRFARLKELLEAKKTPISQVRAFVATGGLLHPIEGGTYAVSIDMLQDLLSCKYGESPANLGAPLVNRLATAAGSRYAYVVDPPVVDEMSEYAHITGFPGFRRRSVFHALNQKAVAHREASKLGKTVRDCGFVVCHLSGSVSVGAHAGGKVVEVNDIQSASGPMSLTQSGNLPPLSLLDTCFSGKYGREEAELRLRELSGLKGHLGTDNFDEIIKRFRAGDRKTALVMEAFLHQLAKQVGACAGVLHGQVDAVILTGRLCENDYFCSVLGERVGWIAPVSVYPGEEETLALVEGVLRVLKGVEGARSYS